MINLNNILEYKIEQYLDLKNNNVFILKTSNIFNINSINRKPNIFINIGLVNNIRRINKFHNSVNIKMDINSHYIICSETLEERRKRVWTKSPKGFKYLVRLLDFIYKRVIPKLPIIKKVYFLVTKGRNRVISKPEILGRLISCGFEIIQYFEYENLFYVISKKIKQPDYNLSPSYSPIFKMNRIGYNKKQIKVYKLRTMYPYSEYLQELITKENKLEKSGKIAHDYRITNWGKFCRKFWIDELPMLMNLLKGELNIVGVRPLSIAYFSSYPKELQRLRVRIKPGLIPPYYSDMPKNFDEILESERIYITKKLKSPFITDIIYFLKAFINIVFKGARSN